MSKPTYKYVYQMPYAHRRKLCDILNADEKWEELAGMHMEFETLTITLLKKKENPTESLLVKWGQQNNTINHLFKLLYKMKHYQAMNIIVDLVDPKYHVYLQEPLSCAISESINSYSFSSMPKRASTLSTNSKINSVAQKSDLGACGVNIDLSSQFENLNKNIPSSKPVYDRFNGIPKNLTDKNENLREIDRNRNDSYFDTRKWLPEKKIVNQPEISLNLATSVKHPVYQKKENNLDNNPSNFDNDCKLLKKPAADNYEISIKSNDSRVRKSSTEIRNALQSTCNIDYNEIMLSTNNFDPSNIIGRGGFGEVYRGFWKNTEVAIKRLIQRNSTEDTVSDVSINQSLIELKSLINYRHDNILPLYGVSIGGPQPCLVYQYMKNGSLEDRLLCRKGTIPLTWCQRAMILKGTACGIQFLHESEVPLIHGDIKSANILLDSHLEPKIGDFGLAREGPQGHYTHVEVSSLHGTQYYLPMEYLRNRTLTTKVDTYSFGIVLLEVATGLRAFDSKRPTCKLLLDYVNENEGNIHLIRDKNGGVDHSDWFFEIIKLGKKCTHTMKKNRPEMIQVHKILTTSWLEEEQKEGGRKISREGLDLPRDEEMSPIAMQAYYDEKKKLSLASNQGYENNASLTKSIKSSESNHESFYPKGPPSRYIPPRDLPTGAFNDMNSTNDGKLELNSPSENFSADSTNIPLLTCLGMKDDMSINEHSKDSELSM